MGLERSGRTRCGVDSVRYEDRERHSSWATRPLSSSFWNLGTNVGDRRESRGQTGSFSLFVIRPKWCSRKPFNPQFLILLLTYVQSCATLPRVISNDSLCNSLQPFCFHTFAASLTSPKKSTPLESNKSSLFFKITRGGGVPQKSRLWNQQHPDPFCRLCLQFSYGFPPTPNLSLCLGASVAIQSAPFSASASTRRSLRLCVIFCLRPRPRTFADSCQRAP